MTVTSKDTTRIGFDRVGRGPSVILVGGAFQFRAIDQRTAQLAEMLGKDFTVIHYDRRGRGESTDTLPYAIDREIEDLEALIKAVGGSAVAFGMSSGAVLCLEAAARGLALTKLALYEAPFTSGDNSALQAHRDYTSKLNSLLAENRRGDAAALAMMYFGAPREMVEGMRQAPVWSLFESVAPTLAYDNALMRDRAVPVKLIGSVKVPTLVVDGGASPAFMREAADAIAAALPGAQRRTLPGQTHNVDPEVLAPVLRDFYQAVREFSR